MLQKSSNRGVKRKELMPSAEWYTIVGFYPDNRERSVRHVLAKSPERAEKAVEKTMERRNIGYCVVSVFLGRLASCDNYTDSVNGTYLC